MHAQKIVFAMCLNACNIIISCEFNSLLYYSSRSVGYGTPELVKSCQDNLVHTNKSVDVLNSTSKTLNHRSDIENANNTVFYPLIDNSPVELIKTINRNETSGITTNMSQVEIVNCISDLNLNETNPSYNSNLSTVTNEPEPVVFKNNYNINEIADDLIKLKNLKGAVDNVNLNCSNNSLNSDNLSSPMQTSTDVFLDSELLSTDLTSNDSQSPKNLQNNKSNDLIEKNSFVKDCIDDKSSIYASNETFSNIKSEESLLNSEDSCDSSPVHKQTKEYKKTVNRHKNKKYFGLKTLQSILNKRDGYSDVSSTGSDIGEDLIVLKKIDSNKSISANKDSQKIIDLKINEKVTTLYNDRAEVITSNEENVHNFFSDIFTKNTSLDNNVSITVSKTAGTKKQFKMQGQNLRVGKALRLCPNDELHSNTEFDQKREKFLARYVYNTNSVSVDGVGDPDFGTPV